MGTIHHLIEAKGKRAALDVAGGDRERRAIEAAAAYMAEEQSEIAFLFSGWAHAALPHRRIADDALWRVETEHVTLLVEPGRRPLPGGENAWVGVPYGSRARLIMLYLQSEALRTNSRDVELGRSLSAWPGRLGIPPGGKSYRDVKEQASRISRCHRSFHIQAGGRTGLVGMTVRRNQVPGPRQTPRPRRNRTDVLRVGDALNRAVLPALTLIGSSVRGLNPLRALVLATRNMPNDGRMTKPSFLSVAGTRLNQPEGTLLVEGETPSLRSRPPLCSSGKCGL
jgi:Plasmid encoded RepA protein